MKRLLFMMVAVSVFHSVLFSQEKTYGIKVKGFVKTDLMRDSRQTVAAREGHFLLFPANENIDANGDDLNAKANLNMLGIQTRLTGSITGPDVGSAKTTGTIEGAFFGHSNSDVNGFRLRHAFLKLSWEKSTLLIGQYWHPMFITECFPGVVSFNTGSPFQPFSRNPQIRFTQKMNNLNMSATAASQRDFASSGPDGGGSIYLRNSALPILNLTLKYISQCLTTGIGANYMSLAPRLGTDTGFKTNEKINSIALMGFAKLVKNDLTLKVESIYGSNMSDLLMLGGYAVTNTELSTGVETYTGVNTLSTWGEIMYGKALQYGLFFGYTENLGADDNITGAFYGRGRDIANIMRVSPRVQITKGKVRFSGEVEYTVADYGTPDVKGTVKNTTSVSNLRILFASYLFF